MIKEHKVPTLLALFFLSIGLIGGLFLVQRGSFLFLRANPDVTPSEIKITNITDSSFAVSWLTIKEASGFVRFGETGAPLGQGASDDRDQTNGQTGSFFTHHVTVKNLKTNTKYLFKIGSNDQLFDNAGKPYEVTTAKTPAGSPASDLVTGKILGVDGQAAAGTIVYLSIANAISQSALVGNDGSWFISLGTAFSSNLTGFATYDRKAQVEEIFVQGGPAGTATAVTTTENDNPIPEITLGKTYDFRQKGETTNPPEGTTLPTGTISPTLSPTPATAGSPTPADSGFVLPTGTASPSSQLTLTNPAKEGEVLNTQKPAFNGNGAVGKTIQILVESSNPYTGVAVVNQDGTWTWTPPANLAPGEHKITITSLGKTLTRTFTVFASDNLPAFTATPSGTQTPTPTLYLTPTPSTRLSPTPTIRLTPTPTTALSRTVMPATAAGIPRSGEPAPTFLIFLVGLLFLGGGLLTKRYW